jgi:hypothetical protein
MTASPLRPTVEQLRGLPEALLGVHVRGPVDSPLPWDVLRHTDSDGNKSRHQSIVSTGKFFELSAS